MSAPMLQGESVGLIGFGQIGRAMTLGLAGWGVTLQAHARRVPKQPSRPSHGLPMLRSDNPFVDELHHRRRTDNRGFPPLTAATRVRVPQGTPTISTSYRRVGQAAAHRG